MNQSGTSCVLPVEDCYGIAIDSEGVIWNTQREPGLPHVPQSVVRVQPDVDENCQGTINEFEFNDPDDTNDRGIVVTLTDDNVSGCP